jgi:hypothetical protein
MLWIWISIRARCTTLCDKFVSDLWQVSGFLQVLRFPPPIKLTFQFTETNCAYFMFPKGGDFDHTTLSFTKHDLTPIVSANKICFPCTSGRFLTRLMGTFERDSSSTTHSRPLNILNILISCINSRYTISI